VLDNTASLQLLTGFDQSMLGMLSLPWCHTACPALQQHQGYQCHVRAIKV
jgi:hypothetical protein